MRLEMALTTEEAHLSSIHFEIQRLQKVQVVVAS